MSGKSYSSVVAHIERLTKEGLIDENEEMRNADDVGSKKSRIVVEVVMEKKRYEIRQKDVESEENIVVEEEQQEVEEMVKGRKRRIHNALSNDFGIIQYSNRLFCYPQAIVKKI
ncbi:uncharacterized protein EDB93DRAFT_1101705 [Suillus bovinus]|uniref:uncharacterized protein n=1 Tax=Suillus bovinus TaxID=48563 RepID=UPI001B86956A|nr:uncharacterized protein EDB93DRAFT_1101705 [Suillus bovinus]KAG2155939.1 hypothetical protein EDB93DRAFT_1101705 [Suillus bovinus]